MADSSPSKTESATSRRVRWLFIGVVGAWLVGLYSEVRMVIGIAGESIAVDLQAPLFPGLLSIPEAAIVAYVVPGVGAMFWIWRLNRRRALALAVLMVCSATFILFHADYFSDAWSLSLFWTSIWICWLATRVGTADNRVWPEAKWLTKSMVVMFFFCSAIGKWTGGYWSGEIFYDLFFVENDTSLYPWLRSHLDPDQLRSAATWYSRLVTVAETAVVAAALLRYRHFAAVATFLVVGTVVGAGYQGGVGALMLPIAAIVVGVFVANVVEEDVDDRPALAEAYGRWSEASRSFRFLSATHLVIIASMVAMTIAPPLQSLWMKQHHGVETRGAVWAAVHVVPKMYTFEHEIPYFEDEFGERFDGETHWQPYGCVITTTRIPRWFQHYPARLVVSARCQVPIFSHEFPIDVVYRSHYRSTCLESRLRLDFVEDVSPLAHRVFIADLLGLDAIAGGETAVFRITPVETAECR